MSESNVAINVLALTQAITVFNQFLPPVTDIRKTDPNNDTGRLDVRIGELAAASLTIAIGAILSVMTNQKQPLYVAIFAALFLVGVYEYVLRCDPR